jgi:ubiquinone biosynthesis protein UbiJ
LAAPRRVHLESLARQGDVAAEAELAALPDLPDHAVYLWRWFGDLRSTLQGNGMAPPRITRHDIHAWEADNLTTLTAWERAAILQLDAAYLSAGTKADETPRETA